LTWDGAQQRCAEMHTSAGYAASLTSVSSWEELSFINNVKNVKDGKPRWVGVRTRPPKGDFTDDNGKHFVNDWWYENEPSGEDCVQQGKKGRADTSRWRLNDNNCAIKNQAMCSWCGPPKASTTSTTPSPTTTTTAEPPCVVKAPLHASGAALGSLVSQIQSMGNFVASHRSRVNGKTDKARQTCEAFCNNALWGLGCAPCPEAALTSEKDCLAPGPFGTGALCRTVSQKGIKTFVSPSEPCCGRQSPSATCNFPPNCDCSTVNGSKMTDLFSSLTRSWTKKEGCSIIA